MNEITNDLLYHALMRRADRERSQLLKACRHNAKLNKQFEDLQTCYCPQTGEIVLSDEKGNVQKYVKELNGQRNAPADKEN
jgi:hypothetical protein